ncbi:MAG: transposase [Myxococcales bacterium]|nr:transposase [Myxococcales bacterium]
MLWHRGHKYLTVVYQIDAHCRRLLWIGEDRTKGASRGFFDWFGLRARWLRFVCSDQHKPYLTAIGRQAKQAVHVLDRFHIVQRLNKAIDQVRAAEVKARARWLRGPSSRGVGGPCSSAREPDQEAGCQAPRPAQVQPDNGARLPAQGGLQLLWDYTSATWAGRFLDRWCSTVMRSRIEPMKKLARSFRVHRELLLNWFRARGEISAAVAEGLNNKLKVITRRAYGLRTLKATEIALYHSLGALPEPEGAHRFF